MERGRGEGDYGRAAKIREREEDGWSGGGRRRDGRGR